jgi:SecD/SecF fusion protein
LNFGLDLQGGMSFIVEVDIDQLIISLAKRKYQSQLLGILKNITDDKKNNPKGFVDEIENRFKNGDLSFSFLDAFENKNNGLSLENSKNEDVKKYLIEKINSSLDKTLTVVKNRIDKNGTIQPLINKINGSRKIQIEVPGVNNDRQIEEMLMNVGALCFWLDYDNDT